MLYLCRVKPLRHYLRGFLIAAWAGDKIAEFSFPEISFHFSLRPWFFFVSPRMRGKALRGFQVHVDAGITPACAGKSFRPIWGVEKTPDHPRMCGEKLALYNELNNHQGSPPHVRGKVECVIDTVGMRGITPACAGKRNKLQGWSAVHQDHPRMCGEKIRRAKCAG